MSGRYRSLLLTSLLWTSVASGDEAANRETARALYTEGTKLVEHGATHEALSKFEAAYTATPTPIIGLAWARAHESLTELVEARDRALNASLLPLQAAETTRSEKAREELTKILADLGRRVPKVTISLGTSETALKLTLAGMPIQKALVGQPLIRNPGKYILIATCGKETVRTLAIDLKEGEHREIDLALIAIACTTKVAPTRGRTISDGLVLGGAISFVPYIALPPGNIPMSSKWSAAAGLTAEIGYAISPKLLLLMRGLVSFGPQGEPTYLASVGPTILFRLDVLSSGDPLWITTSFHCGRAQTEFSDYPGKYSSEWVFGTQLGLEVPFAERENGYWYFGASAGALVANLNAKDTPFVFLPISFGVRSF